MAPYFSVVIPTHNRAGLLQRVLDALGAQRGAPEFEIVVVDDGSEDETRAVLERRRERMADTDPPLTFRSQPNGGPGRARNHGVALAAGRFVVFIGDDTVPEPEFLAEHFRIHHESGDDPLVAALGYTGWPRGERVTAFMDYINDFGLQFGYGRIEDGAIVSFKFFYTSNISIDRHLLAAHPFDTRFPAAAWEDIELAYRLDALGLKIRYNARAVTRHHHPMTVDSFAKRQYMVGRSGAIFFGKHPELGPFLGVDELGKRRLADDTELERLHGRARWGERFRFLARPRIFRKLMQEHYLRGLRDGLREAGGANQRDAPGHAR
jgi:glycosyltransferase involved in cell wall biosynthesis